MWPDWDSNSRPPPPSLDWCQITNLIHVYCIGSDDFFNYITSRDYFVGRFWKICLILCRKYHWKWPNGSKNLTKIWKNNTLKLNLSLDWVNLSSFWLNEIFFSRQIFKPVLVVLSQVHNIIVVLVHFRLIWLNQPPHDKTSKVTVHTAKTQISLGIRPVQPGHLPSLIRVFAVRSMGS